MRLLTRLLLYVLAPFLVGSSLILLLVGNKVENLLRQEILSVTHHSLELRSNAIDEEIAGIRRNLQLIASSEIARRPDSAGFVRQLKAWEAGIPGIDGLYFTTLAGNILSGDGPLDQVDIRNRDYFVFIRRGEAFLSAPIVSRATGNRVIAIGVPVLGRDGAILGSIFATVRIQHITGRVRELQPKSGGVAILTDRQGVVLTGHPDEPDATGQAADPSLAPITASIVGTLKTHHDNDIPAHRMSLPGSQENWQVIHMELPHTGWQIALVFPESQFFGIVDNIWQIGARIILLLTLAVGVAVAVFNRSLLSPISQLAAAQSQLEQGDYSVRTESNRHDELGELSRAFDRMTAQLQNALHAAQDSAQRFRSIFENAHDAIFIMDGDRFIACNPATERLFGNPCEILLQTGPVALSPAYQSDGKTSLAAGQFYIDAALAGEPQRFPWIHRNSTGRLFEVEVSLQRIEFDGKPMLQAILRDLSGQRRAEIMEEKYQRIFEACPDYIIVAQLEDGLITEANRGFEHLTGIPAAEAIGRQVLELGFLVHPDDRALMVDQLKKEGRTQNLVMQMCHRDGTLREVNVSAALLTFDNAQHYIVIAHDITEISTTYRALQASETRLKTILEATPTPICINRLADFAYLSTNPAWEKLYGFSAAQALGNTFWKLGLRASDLASLKAQTAQLLAEGRLDNVETEFIHPDGHRIPLVYSSRIITLDGEPAMLSINTDISRLKETEKRLRTLLDAAPVLIAIFRLPDFTYLEVNHEFEKLFGKTLGEIRGLTPGQAGFLAVEPEIVREQNKHLLAEGRFDTQEAAFRIPDGRIVTILYSSRIIELDGSPAVISMAIDISQQKTAEAVLLQAQEELRESEARFSVLFQSSPVAMGVFLQKENNYRISQLNEAWYSTFAYTPDQVIGKTTWDFKFQVHPEDRTRLLAILERDGVVRNFETWLNRGDGSVMLCLVSCRLLRVGKQHLILAGYQDITKQREIEEALRNFNTTLETRIQERTRELQSAQAELMRSEKLAALGSLVAGVAHELNTPIGTSLTVATTLTDRTRAIQDMLASGMRRSALESYLGEASSGTAILTRNLQRAAELIQSFKSIAVDQGSNQRRPFNLHEIVEETLTALRPSLKKKPYALRQEIDTNITLESYPGPLEQVIVNLINNAVLHGFEGRDSGTVLVQAQKIGSDNVRIAIVDDGCGIPPAHLARIFDPFFTTKLGRGGSGLGLHIVRNIVEDVLGGRIYAESTPGKGTVMTLEIPSRAPELKLE